MLSPFRMVSVATSFYQRSANHVYFSFCETYSTLSLFDDKYEMIHDHADIKKVSLLTDREYFARGSTALLDAIGKTINHVGNRHKFAPDSEIPVKTMVVIITDGFENASTEFSQPQIKAMIEHQKEKYGWEFLFLGANIDAVSKIRGQNRCILF